MHDMIVERELQISISVVGREEETETKRGTPAMIHSYKTSLMT